MTLHKVPDNFKPGPIEGSKGLLVAGMYVAGNDPDLLGMKFGGDPIEILRASANNAIENAGLFREVVKALFGDRDYAHIGNLPLLVSANREIGAVETKFPQRLTDLVASPEVYLIWADKLEEAAAELLPSA